jgi:hypothetical protein
MDTESAGTDSSRDAARKIFVLQESQPALLGLMDCSVSTLAPIFATAGLTRRPASAFFVGFAASLGAGVSMGLCEALSDDGTVTRRGNPARPGSITGVATGLGIMPGLSGSVRTAHYHVCVNFGLLLCVRPSACCSCVVSGMLKVMVTVDPVAMHKRLEPETHLTPAFQ